MRAAPKAIDKRKAFLYANVFILLSLIAFFSRSILTDRIPTTTDILQTCSFFKKEGLSNTAQNKFVIDPVLQFVPWFHFDIESIKSGELPLWNPYQGCGVPHIGNIQSALFFPLNFFVYLLGMKWGLLMLYLMRLYFCGIFIYLYLHKVRIDYRAAIIGSIAGMFTGYNTMLLYLANSALAFYIPLGLWSIELIIQHQDSIKGYIMLCLGFALAIFAGHPETLFYGTSIVLIYSLTRILQEYKQRGSKSKVLLKMFCFLIIGILISCIQLIPFLEYMFHSYMYYVKTQVTILSAASLSSIAFGIVNRWCE